MTTEKELFNRFVAMLQVAPVDSSQTGIFTQTPHEMLCHAFSSWFSQLQLLFGEPVQISITQGLRDQGVDLIVEFQIAGIKFGLQIKSHGDVEEKDFHRKVMAQITNSKKHKLSRLFVVLCSDQTNFNQAEKTRGLISDLSQIGDYAIPVIPERAVVILESFLKKQHPLNYIKGTSEIATLMEGLSRALSDESYEASVTITSKLRDKLQPTDYDVSGHISFKPGSSALKGMDLIRQATKAGQPVTIPGDIIQKLTFLDKNGKPLVPKGAKADYLTIIPEISRLPPMNLQTTKLDTGKILQIQNVQFVREKLEANVLYLTTFEAKIKFSLVLDFEKHEAKFFGGVERSASIDDALKFGTFMAAVLESKHLDLLDPKDKHILPMDVQQSDFEKRNFDVWLGVLADLLYIESKLGTSLPVPDSITTYDVELTKIVRALLQNEKVELKEYAFGLHFKKTSAEKALKSIQESGMVSGIVLKTKMFKVKLFSKELSLGPVRIEVPYARPIEDLQNIENSYKALKEDELLPIQFVSCRQQPTLHPGE